MPSDSLGYLPVIRYLNKLWSPELDSKNADGRMLDKQAAASSHHMLLVLSLQMCACAHRLWPASAQKWAVTEVATPTLQAIQGLNTENTEEVMFW